MQTNNSQTEFFPVKLLVVLVGSIIIAEIIAHSIINILPPLPYLTAALIDSAITAGLTFPILLLFSFRPLSKEIARRKEAEQVLQENKAFYQNLIEDQTELIFHLDKNGKINFVNEAVSRFWDRPADFFNGKDFNLLLSPTRDFQPFEPNLLNPIVTGEKRLVLSNGASRWVSWTVRALIGSNGIVDSFQAVGRDVTENHRSLEELRLVQAQMEQNIAARTAEIAQMNSTLRKEIVIRQQTEEDLKEREARLELIIEQTLAILWTTDLNLNITSLQGSALKSLDINPAWRYGDSIDEVFDPVDRQTILEAHRRAMKGEPTHYELKLKDRVFENHIRPYFNRSQELTGCIGVGLDITTMRQAEATIRIQTAALKAQPKI